MTAPSELRILMKDVVDKTRASVAAKAQVDIHEAAAPDGQSFSLQLLTADGTMRCDAVQDGGAYVITITWENRARGHEAYARYRGKDLEIVRRYLAKVPEKATFL